MRIDFADLPKEIQERGFDFHWDNQKVWSLKVPIEEISTSELEHMLDLPFWRDDNKTPRQIMNDIDAYPNRQQRVMNADTSYPLDIMKNVQGEYIMLDGLHRFVKLLMNGEKKVRVRKISRKYISHIEK